MKTKIKKVSSCKNIPQRLDGQGTFRVTGGNKSGKRLVIYVVGNREDAEKASFRLDDFSNNQIVYGIDL